MSRDGVLDRVGERLWVQTTFVFFVGRRIVTELVRCSFDLNYFSERRGIVKEDKIGNDEKGRVKGIRVREGPIKR